MGCHLQKRTNGTGFLPPDWTVIAIWVSCTTVLCLSLLQLWFMQDGATSHIANVALDFLQDTFGPHVISHQHPVCYGCGQKWPPKSPATSSSGVTFRKNCF
jgi:hypothetical protein